MDDPNYNAAIPGHVDEAHVLDFDVFDFETKDPYVAIRDLFEGGIPEIIWTRHNGGHWVVRGVEAITALASQPVLFSSTRLMVPDNQNADEPSFPPSDLDPPLHTQYRAILAPLFTPSRVRLVEEAIREICDELIGDILKRGECEFIADFAAQMPIVIFLRLLDLPREDRARLRAISHRVNGPVSDELRFMPLQELSNYLRPIVEDRQANPRDDLISFIASQKIDGRVLSLDEIVKLSRTALLGSLDTIPSALGFFARYLAENAEARRRLLEHPEVIKSAVEEILRRFPVSQIGRVLSEDVIFRGVPMKKGEHVVWLGGMYNLDERRFPDPLTVDFDRKRTPHASFGLGVHFCVASQLARAQLAIFAEHWLKQIPDFHVKPGAPIKYRGGLNINYKSLPLVVGAAPH
jgi:cytochrome P450